MKKLLALCTCLHLLSGFSKAQIIGSDTVCAGYIYNYSIVVPGAVTYVWTVPANWYDLSGQGTSQISVTCNVNTGDVCVESFDTNSVSLGIQCLTTNFGSDGSGNYHLEPSGNNEVCDGVSSVSILPTMVYDGPGGGGCLPGCGNGTLHPNIVWGIYSGPTFQGIVGTYMTLDVGNTYAIAHVDISNGANFPQAIQIGGCGGTVSGSFSLNEMYLSASTYVSPSFVCVGDTFLLINIGNGGGCGSDWSQFINLIPLTDTHNPMQIQVVAIGTPVSYMFATCKVISSGILSGTNCWAVENPYFAISICAVDAGFSVSSTTICEDNCLAFSNTTIHGSSYEWSFPGAIPSNSLDTNPTNICYPDTGFYDVTLIASNPDFTDTLFLPGYIHVVSAPQADFIADANSICSNDCINFSNLSVNASIYQWNFPGGNPSSSTDSFPGPVCYPGAGNYDVTLVTQNAGCSDTLTIPEAIDVAQSPQSGFSVSQSNLCPGSCVDYYNQSTDGSAFLWNFQGATIDSSTEENPVMICYTDSGQFDVTLISTNGNCSDTLIVPQYISVYPAPPPVSIQQSGDTLFASTGFSSYEWYLNGNLISGATDSFYMCTSNGDYNVVASDTNGCEVEAAIYNVLTKLTSVHLGQQDFVIYPNPVKELLSIVLPASFAFTEKTTFKILNFQNRIVFSASLNSRSIPVNQLSAGMYFIEIVGDKEVLRTSFLKVY